MTTTRIVLTIATLTLREASRRRVMLALAAMTVVLLAAAGGSRAWPRSQEAAR